MPCDIENSWYDQKLRTNFQTVVCILVTEFSIKNDLVNKL